MQPSVTKSHPYANDTYVGACKNDNVSVQIVRSEVFGEQIGVKVCSNIWNFSEYFCQACLNDISHLKKLPISIAL